MGERLELVFVLTLCIVAAIGVIGAIVMRTLRRSSIKWQIVSLVLTVGVTTVVSIGTVTSAMLFTHDDLLVVLVITGTATAGAVAVSWLIGRQLVTHSRYVRSAATQVAQGGALRLVDPPMNREFASILQALRESHTALGASQTEAAELEMARRNFLTWISHDLRSPLASFRAILDGIEDGIIDDPKPYLHHMQRLTSRLDLLVDDLFHLSIIDAGALTLDIERVDIADLTSDIVAELRPLSDEHCVTFDAPRGGFMAEVDPALFSRVLSNLVGNALQHTPAGTLVRIGVERMPDNSVVVEVNDDGPGLSAVDASRAFEVGWRQDVARAEPPSGLQGMPTGRAGLGLAIVRGIVHAHRGSIHLATEPGTGCSFRITLPGEPDIDPLYDSRQVVRQPDDNREVQLPEQKDHR